MDFQAFPKIRNTTAQELSPSIHWAQRHNRTPQFTWKRRIYDFEILYIIQGKIKVTLLECSFFVPSGGLLLLPPGVYHQIEVMVEPHVQLLGIHFDFFNELQVKSDDDIIVDEQNPVDEYYCAMPYIDDNPILPIHRVLSPPPQIVSLMEFLIHEWNERNLEYELTCNGLLLQIIALLRRYQNEQSRSIHTKYETSLIALINDLDKNYKKKWTATEMAKFLNVHEDYMSKLFKDMIGMGPNKYLQYIRHQHAKQLLRETDHKIETIALEVGYKDLYYFSRVFKKWEGISAYQYRKLSQIF